MRAVSSENVRFTLRHLLRAHCIIIPECSPFRVYQTGEVAHLQCNRLLQLTYNLLRVRLRRLH